jgi:hypothetical protein
MNKYAAMFIGFSLSKQLQPTKVLHRTTWNTVSTRVYSLIKYKTVNKTNILKDILIDNKEVLGGSGRFFLNDFDNDDILVEFENDDQAILWFKLNY